MSINRVAQAMMERERASRYVSEEVKREVIAKSSGCFYCGTPWGPFEFDHFTPFSRGGDSSTQNIVLACLPCNRAKGSALPSVFLRKSAAECDAKAAKLLKVAEAMLGRS